MSTYACGLAFAHVQIFENFFSALHVSPCSSLGLGAHLDSLDSAIVMATLELHFSGHVCLFQRPRLLGTYKNHVEFVCFMCTAVFTSVGLRMMCTNLCLCTAGQLYDIYLPVGGDPNCHDLCPAPGPLVFASIP